MKVTHQYVTFFHQPAYWETFNHKDHKFHRVSEEEGCVATVMDGVKYQPKMVSFIQGTGWIDAFRKRTGFKGKVQSQGDMTKNFIPSYDGNNQKVMVRVGHRKEYYRHLIWTDAAGKRCEATMIKIHPVG